MPRFHSCRLIIDPAPQTGAWNMAVDEALLESAVAGGLPTVRFYRWSRPTVSLGYFQPLDAAAAWTADSDVDVVRRLTGGGAIVHHHEWTYSCTLPGLAPLLKHPYDLYDIVHHALCDAVHKELGITLERRGITRRSAAEPVLCYLRETEHDVCFHRTKVIGSAQRRRRGALLQHGSILWKESIHARGIPGLFDLCPDVRLISLHDPVWTAIAQDLAHMIGVEVVADKLTESERERAAHCAGFP